MRARFIAAPVLALLAGALLVAPTAAFADGSSDGTATAVDSTVTTTDPSTGAAPAPADTTAGQANMTADVTNPTSCPDAPVSQPFTSWGDSNFYELVSGGDFENDYSGWTLSPDAQVVSGNEPYYVGNSTDSSSLHLGSSGSATSDTVCLDPNTPTLRFFVQNNGSVRHSWLKVSVNYTDSTGTLQTMTIGWIGANSNWQPVAPVSVLANDLSALSGPTDVTFTFTTVGWGNGDWSIDDVYLDPFKTK